MLIREEWKNLKSYLRDNIAYICVAAIVVIAVYGIRAFRSGFCIDSEIMIAQPDYMKSIWLGSNRFGMYIISEICGMQRLSPYLSGFIMMLTMWITAVALGYACWNWSGKGRDSRVFVMLFPLLAVTSPLFAEQYLFILQAFEISMGLLLTVVSVYCTNRVARILDEHADMPENECSWSASNDESASSTMSIYHTKMAQLSHFMAGGVNQRAVQVSALLLIGLISAVIAFGTYQTFVPLYLALVLIAFILGYLNSRLKHPFKYCLSHAAIFLLSLALYVGVSLLVRHITHSESSYITGMFRWKADGIAAGLQAIKTVMTQCALGQGPFFQKWFLPAAGLFGLQGMIIAWKKKNSLADFMLFLVGMAALMLTPFALVILTGGIQAARTELVYPFVSAFALTHLCVLPHKTPRVFKAAMCAICLFCLTRQGNTTVQMFQTAYEAYRNDVITATQMYPKLVETAGDEELQNCEVAFVGSKRTSLYGPAVFGELCGRSMFDAEPSSRNGATNRLVPFFSILGMNMRVLPDTEAERYAEVAKLMQDAPSWPKEGSVRKIENGLIAVKLSD